MSDSKLLRDSLSRLRSEIQALDIRDQETKQRLDTLVFEIETRIKNPNEAGSDERLIGPLKASTLNFEVSHPRLAGLMNDVLEKLGAMGI